MNSIRDATIQDILPDKFISDEGNAFAAAVKRMTEIAYDKFMALLFWGDIDNASGLMLDAMAAELAAPFYENSMPIEQRRSIIKATFKLNSSVGTTYAVKELLTAAFGGNGSISEWFEYDGKPYYFKTTVATAYPSTVTKEGYEIFLNNIDRIKPKRAKFEAAVFTRSNVCNAYVGMCAISTFKTKSIPAAIPEAKEV